MKPYIITVLFAQKFYPQGSKTYVNYCFLFSSDYNQSVISLFSLVPTTPVIMEVGDHLSVLKISPDVSRDMFYTIVDMQTKKMIKEFSSAAVFCDYK